MPKRSLPGHFSMLAAIVLAACTLASFGSEAAPLLLVSLDGFRWDYCALHPAEAEHLRRYAAEGISARELIPVYPSNTFPNHYSIVTGLYPAHHGIINNEFFDPTLNRYFRNSLPAQSSSPDWWRGEPIWVTAIRQGRKSASYYWVGSEAAIDGIRPTFAMHFDMDVYNKEPFESRIDRVVSWLRFPADQRPSLITFYIEETNSAGHSYGPDSPELAAAVKLVDGRLGALMGRLKAEKLPVNLIVVSDHGMTPVNPERVILIDDYINLDTVQIDFQSPEMRLRPVRGSPADLLRALAHLPHARAYLTENQPELTGHVVSPHPQDSRPPDASDYLPERLHLSGNPRIPEVWIMPDEGWHVQTRKHSLVPSAHDQKGDHGFDPTFRSMHGILIADGPSFKTGGEVIGPVENIHIYNLMCAVLHLAPARNDGDSRLVSAFLR